MRCCTAGGLARVRERTVGDGGRGADEVYTEYTIRYMGQGGHFFNGSESLARVITYYYYVFFGFVLHPGMESVATLPQRNKCFNPV